MRKNLHKPKYNDIIATILEEDEEALDISLSELKANTGNASPVK